MSRGRITVQVEDLGAALSQTLTLYHQDVNEAIDRASERAVKKIASRSKATAPVGARGSFKRNISSKLLKKSRNGSTYVWYVKGPDHRLTHLLVHGHATKNGGRTKGNSFLGNAVDQTLPEYLRDVEEAIKNGK